MRDHLEKDRLFADCARRQRVTASVETAVYVLQRPSERLCQFTAQDLNHLTSPPHPVRVTDLIARHAGLRLIGQAQVDDIWKNPSNNSHVGIVRAVQADASGTATRVDVQHDSSRQGAAVSNWFTTGDFFR
jgi:hypothetical protein